MSHSRFLKNILSSSSAGTDIHVLRREIHPLAAYRVGPGDDGRGVQHVVRDVDCPPIFPRLEDATSDPLVESTHRGTAPDLIVHFPARLTTVRR